MQINYLKLLSKFNEARSNRSWVISKSLKSQTHYFENGRVKTKEHATQTSFVPIIQSYRKSVILGSFNLITHILNILVNKISDCKRQGWQYKLKRELSTALLKYFYQHATAPEVESRTQGSRPRPRTQKKSETKARTALPRTDPFEAKDRNARGQGQGHKRKCSPKKKKIFTRIFQAISKKNRSSQEFFRQSPERNVFQKFSWAPQNFNNSKNSAAL